MKIIVRGYGDGKLVLEDREEFTTPEELNAIAGRHIEDLTRYELHMIEIEFLDEPDPLQRFMRFGNDSRGMVLPLELPTHCQDCGAVLMGGATRHAPDCAWTALINESFGCRLS